MSKDPAFLMYPKDWLSGTAEYMPAEKGVYIDLLCHQHQKGDLPADIDRLSRMVGLSKDDFIPIWGVISGNFEQMDNRLVNRKLRRLMDERSEKGKLNTITGTFAGMLRLGNYPKAEYTHLRKHFKPSDFMIYDKDEITVRLTEWLHKCLKSIGNANEDISIDIKGNILTIEERQQNFKNEIEQIAESKKYSIDMLTSFYAYWSEPNRAKTKMKCEMQKTWDTARRLTTWANNDKKFKR